MPRQDEGDREQGPQIVPLCATSLQPSVRSCDRVGSCWNRGQVEVDQAVDRTILHTSNRALARSRPSNVHPSHNGRPTLVQPSGCNANPRAHESGNRFRDSRWVHLHTRLMDGTGAVGLIAWSIFDPQHAPELVVGTNLIDYEFPLGNFANGTYSQPDLERPDVEWLTDSETR